MKNRAIASIILIIFIFTQTGLCLAIPAPKAQNMRPTSENPDTAQAIGNLLGNESVAPTGGEILKFNTDVGIIEITIPKDKAALIMPDRSNEDMANDPRIVAIWNGEVRPVWGGTLTPELFGCLLAKIVLMKEKVAEASDKGMEKNFIIELASERDKVGLRVEKLLHQAILNSIQKHIDKEQLNYLNSLLSVYYRDSGNHHSGEEELDIKQLQQSFIDKVNKEAVEKDLAVNQTPLFMAAFEVVKAFYKAAIDAQAYYHERGEFCDPNLFVDPVNMIIFSIIRELDSRTEEKYDNLVTLRLHWSYRSMGRHNIYIGDIKSAIEQYGSALELFNDTDSVVSELRAIAQHGYPAAEKVITELEKDRQAAAPAAGGAEAAAKGKTMRAADARGAGMNGGAQVDAPAAGLKALVLSYKYTIDEKIIEIAKENPNIDKKVELIGGLPATFEGFRNELKKRRAEIEEIKPDMILVHMPNGEFGLARAMAELINTLTGIKASGLLDDDKENWKTAIDALAESV